MSPNSQFKVHWVDNIGKDRSKVYSDYKDAQKAYKWLIEHGADNVDLAILR